MTSNRIAVSIRRFQGGTREATDDPSGVRSIWPRPDLQTFQLRLKVREAKLAQDGLILTNACVKLYGRKNALVALCRKIYCALDRLQADLDTWLDEYNQSRPHSGEYCFGETPILTF
ncbi:MAG: hypothetical protein ACYTAS_13490, partial [Planctomycetota bacterium]